MSEIFEQLVRGRGFSCDYVKPKYENLANPFLLPDMKKAISRVKNAIRNGEKVLIFGDYDADGVTASSVMMEALILSGIRNVEVMLPNRFLDGYGMCEKVVQRAVDGGFSLVITVDCGSGNSKIVSELGIKGIDVIVTDHHECPDELPDSVAIINPKRKDFSVNEKYGLKDLAGVGVAFEFARALVLEGLVREGQEKWLLDLVLIGTVCDSMKMTMENRIFCYFGRKVLGKTRRKGLKELMKVAQIEKLDTEAIGFRIGPRINAAGRMDTPEIAFDLLNTKSSVQAARLAKMLDDLNSKRKVQQDRAIKEIKKRKGELLEDVIVVSGEWHEGILGIIAGRLVEIYKKPVFVFSRIDDVYKGSGRSFGEFDLSEAIFDCADVILDGGGHAAAAGVEVSSENFCKFKKRINAFYKSKKLKNQERFLERKEDIILEGVHGVSIELLDEISELEPFGEGDEEPIFLFSGVRVADSGVMGKNDSHLRVEIEGKDRDRLKLVAWNAPEEWVENACINNTIDVSATLSKTEWRGKVRVEGRILKMTLDTNDVF